MELPDGTTLDAMGVDGFAKFANDAKGSAGTSLRNNAKIALDESRVVGGLGLHKFSTGGKRFGPVGLYGCMP